MTRCTCLIRSKDDDRVMFNLRTENKVRIRSYKTWTMNIVKDHCI